MSEKRVVLVLEDLPNWQDTVRLLLQAERGKDGEAIYEVIAANSLDSAMTLLHSRVFDVAIVDICLVEGDETNIEGMIFLDELEKYYADDYTHAIVLSGRGTITLAVDAIKRPYVVDYIQKDLELFDGDHFVLEVARAWRAAEAQRAKSFRRRLRPLSPFLIKAFEVSRLIASLAPELDAIAAARDFELLLGNLLPNFLPLAQELHVTVEPRERGAKPEGHILCWSRKLVRALDVAIGRTGTLDSLQPAAHWHGAGEADLVEKRSAVRHFDGVVFGLPNVQFEEFLSVVGQTA